MEATQTTTPGVAKGAKYVLFIICLTQIFNLMDRQILNLLQESVKHDLGMSDTQMGLVNGIAFSLVYTTVGLPLALWVDRGSRKTILAGCLGVWATATVACGAATTYLQLLLFRMGVAAGESGASPATQSMIADMYPVERRAGALSFATASSAIGITLGMLLGGWLSLFLSWRWVFVIVGAPGILLALVVALTVKEPLRTASLQSASAVRAGLLKAASGLLRIPSVSLALVVIAIASITGYAVAVWSPTFLIRIHGMHTSNAGFSVALSVLCQCAGSMLAGRLADRWGARDARGYFAIGAFSVILFLPAVLAFAYADTPVEAVAALCAFKFLNGMYVVPMFLVTLSLVGSHMRGVASFAINLAINLAGLGIGPFLIGSLNDYFRADYGQQGIQHSMAFAAWAIVPGAIAALWGLKTVRSDFLAHRDGLPAGKG